MLGPRHGTRRSRGRTHVSTRPRATPLLKISLAPKGASTHGAKFVSRPRNGRIGAVFRLGSPRKVRPRPAPFTAVSKLCDRPFLDAFARALPADQHAIMVLDQAGWHGEGAEGARRGHAGAAAALRPRTEPGRARVAVSAGGLPLAPRAGRLR